MNFISITIYLFCWFVTEIALLVQEVALYLFEDQNFEIQSSYRCIDNREFEQLTTIKEDKDVLDNSLSSAFCLPV